MTTTAHSTKAETFLHAATTLGLIVEPMAELPSGNDGWTIRSEFTKQTGCGHVLFVYASDGPRGGRLSYYIYSCHKHTSKRLRSRADARAWLRTLA